MAAKAGPEQVAVLLPDSAESKTTVPSFGFPLRLHLRCNLTARLGPLLACQLMDAHTDAHRLTIPVFFITLSIAFINCITASPSQAISNFKV